MFYTNCISKNSKVYLKYYECGEAKILIDDLQPYAFIEGSNGGFHTIDGKHLEKKVFSSVDEIQKFVETTKKRFTGLGLSHRRINEKDFAYAYISDNFQGHIDYDLNLIKILNIDIETTSEKGFPSVDNPQEIVLSISASITSGADRRFITFGLKPCDTTDYVYCKTEGDLLSNFFDLVAEEAPDVITGWNVETFDIAYICARTEHKYKKDWLKKLSAFQLQPRKSQTERNGKKITIWKIDGTSILDYLDLYKTFTFTAQESYKLDHIAFVELGERKLDYSEHKSLQELWKNDWTKFISYNKKDVTLVDGLIDKLKLIELVVSIAYFTKVNYIDALEKIRPIEMLMYNYLIADKVVLPLREAKDKPESNAGGRVKSPKVGLSEWVVTLDATSLYPSIMMSLNLSPDTFIKKINVSPDDILNRTFNNSMLKQNDYAMSVNGCMFRRDKKGFTTELVESLFNTRDEYKTKMKELKKSNGDPKLIKKYDVFQLAVKILANSVYGAFAAPYFLFFDMDIAEAITLTGQVVAQEADRSVNRYLNGLLKTDKDYVTFSDTDSIGVELSNLVGASKKLETKLQKVDFIDKFADTKLAGVLDTCFDDLSSYLNLYQNRIHFKREKIAEKMVIVGKKNYGMLVWDDEGSRYEEPKIVIRGLAVVKSSTPEFVKGTLRESIQIIFTGSEERLQDLVAEFKETFYSATAEEIAFPRGVTELSKYTLQSKAIPIHVRASLLFNENIKRLDLDKTLEIIRDGDKMRFLYLKLPNPIKQNVIGFKDYLPSEFNINSYVDYDTQFQKVFVKPLESITNIIGWKIEKVNDLSDFF